MENIVVMPHYHHPSASDFKYTQPDWECVLCGRMIAGGYPWVGCTVFTGFFVTESEKHYVKRMEKSRGFRVIEIFPALTKAVQEIDKRGGDNYYDTIYGQPAPDSWYPKVPHKFVGEGEACGTCKLGEDAKIHKKKYLN